MDKIVQEYLLAAKSSAERRGLESLLAFMLAQGKKRVLAPTEIGEDVAQDFVTWIMSPDLANERRYFSLLITRPVYAKIYEALLKASPNWKPVEIKKIQKACTSLTKEEFQEALLGFRRSSSRWVGVDDHGRLFVRQDTIGARSAVAYCAWLSMLWNKLNVAYNPWPFARRIAEQWVVVKNVNAEAAREALASAVKGADPSSMLGARDLWLMCGVALLGLSAREISFARRSDLVSSGSNRILLVKSRGEQTGVAVGPDALTWLHRMEGLIAREVRLNERAKPLLWMDAPLWPSLSSEGPSWHLTEKAVAGCLASRGIKVGALRRVLRVELRHQGATIKQAGAILGSRRDEDPDVRWNDLLLGAQGAIADSVGLRA